MSALRPLPARPSLEYARKEAKSLLRQLRAADSNAVARARACHPAFPDSPSEARLADAQLVVAREHGFASWPKLVRYMGDVERQERAHVQLHGDRSSFEAHATHMLEQHRARSIAAGRTLAAYVPRFYGLTIDDVLASEVDEEDARLAVARSNGAPSWEVLLDRVEQDARARTPTWEIDPIRRASAAMAAADLGALDRIVDAHPALLHPSEYDITAGRTLMWAALGHEKQLGVTAMRPVMGWLASRGFDRQRELDLRLCGHVWMKVDEVKDLLDRGANPSWVAPNGIPVLEHALLRYWNGDAVDVIAARTSRRDAMWIAAGLGDLDGVSRYLDRSGKPTAAARRSRPDAVAVGARGFMPQLPDPDDEEILVEAMLVAMLNGRTQVMEYLASRGTPVNSLVYGTALVTLAAANGMVAAVEALVRSGADTNLRGWSSNQTAQQIARELFFHRPGDAARRRIVEILGMDADALAAERDSQPPVQPIHVPSLRRALMFATADSARSGKPDVAPENLLFGLLRTEQLALGYLKDVGRMEVERFRADFADRLGTSERSENEPDLPLNLEAQAAIDAAIANAIARRNEALGELDLLHSLLRDDGGLVNALLARYGVDVREFRSAIDNNIGSSRSIVYRKRRGV